MRQTRRHWPRGSLVLIGAGVMAGCGRLPFPAPEPRSLPRVGLLQFGTTAASAAPLAAFVQGLRELGYVEGQTIAIDQRVAEGRLEQMPDLAVELLSLHPDVLVVANMEAIQAVRDVSSTVPIVFPAFQDPIENRLGASLARPGGNITGLLAHGPDTAALARRAAGYVDKILKGARPGDLPIELPTTYTVVINLKSADSLGLTIPPSALQQATEVIQ
jgi:ABC-type uncharacterized transport system substrate-binding protein